MSTLHLIEGWSKDGRRGTDAAAMACALAMAPEDRAIVLGPGPAARRAAALGVGVAARWCAPLGWYGGWIGPLRSLTAGLGRFERARVWTPGAVRAAGRLGLSVEDLSGGEGWPAPPPAGAEERARARGELLRAAGIDDPSTILIAAVWDPPAAGDALTAMYAAGLVERARRFDPRPAAVLVQAGTEGYDRAGRLTVGVRQETRMTCPSVTARVLVDGADLVVVPPLDSLRGLAGTPGLEAARRFWALRAGPAALAPENAGWRGWGRAELGRAIRGAMERVEAV